MPALPLSVYAPVPREIHPSWQHQRMGYHFAMEKWASGHPGVMFAYDMGTGKTKIAIDLIGGSGAKTVLVTAPLRVIQVWEKQLALHAGFPYRFACLDDSVPSVAAKADLARQTLRHARAAGQVAIIGINYESARMQPFAAWALNTIWDLCIADEIHRIKAPAGKQSRFMGKLSVRSRRRLGLTGTPMPQTPLDVWAQYRFLDRSIFDETYHSFKTRYAELFGYPFERVKQYRNLDELNRLFYTIAVRVKAEDVLDLPPQMDQALYCVLSPEAGKVYARLESDFIAWLGDQENQLTIANAPVLLLRLQQLTGGTLPSDDGAEHHIDTSKEDLLVDWLDDLPPEEPVVVFYRFNADREAIGRATRRANRNMAEVSGRKNEQDCWKKGEASVLAAQIQVASEGQDFTRARYAAYYSMGFSLKDYLQSRKRIHRPGQARPVAYYHLLARDSVDEIILRAVENRWDLVETVLKEIKECRQRRMN